MKVERVSYPVMTPSAARGVMEAIFWEPQVHYMIDAIRIVRKGRWVSVRRNELTSVVALDSVATWMRSPAKFTPVQAGGGAPDGTQRNMLALQGVEYVITAEMRLTELGDRAGANIAKYVDEFTRRATRGKCFHRPALGVREFAADFEWESDPQAALERRGGMLRDDKEWRNIWPDEDLGLMLYDVFDPKLRSQGFRWLTDGEMANALAARAAPGAGHPTAGRPPGVGPVAERSEGVMIKPRASFFHARIRDARLDCNLQRIRLIV
jgi:CRISPR-associated protein Cas5d